jgi:hypothetical protein
MNLDLSPLEAMVRKAVRAEMAAWEQSHPRPRMLTLKEAADVLGVSVAHLRQLLPELPVRVDRTGKAWKVPSPQVYGIVEAGGIEAVLSDVASSSSNTATTAMEEGNGTAEGVPGSPRNADKSPGVGRPKSLRRAS